MQGQERRAGAGAEAGTGTADPKPMPEPGWSWFFERNTGACSRSLVPGPEPEGDGRNRCGRGMFRPLRVRLCRFSLTSRASDQVSPTARTRTRPASRRCWTLSSSRAGFRNWSAWRRPDNPLITRNREGLAERPPHKDRKRKAARCRLKAGSPEGFRSFLLGGVAEEIGVTSRSSAISLPADAFPCATEKENE